MPKTLIVKARVTVPYAVSPDELKSYVFTAIQSWHGCMDADDPIHEIVVHEVTTSRQMPKDRARG